MFTKAAFLKSLTHEAKIISHLAGQVPAGQLDWRPTPAQRSTREVLQYLTFSALASAEAAITGNWDRYDAHVAASKLVDPAGVSKAMKRQVAAITKLLATVNDAALRKRTAKNWIGKKVVLGDGLIDMVLKQLTAYRMQLFIYLKASGAAQLGTSDCWFGVAQKKQKG